MTRAHQSHRRYLKKTHARLLREAQGRPLNWGVPNWTKREKKRLRRMVIPAMTPVEVVAALESPRV